MSDYLLQEILLPMGGSTIKPEDKTEAFWDDSNCVTEEKYDGHYSSLLAVASSQKGKDKSLEELQDLKATYEFRLRVITEVIDSKTEGGQ